MRKIPDHVLTVVFPVALLVFTVFIERVMGFKCFTACEDGPIETFEAIIMFWAFALGLAILQMPRGIYPQWARVFFALGVVASLYIALEEISYGQRIFGWVTPESWDLVNDQGETNLHNTSSWLDQKPRIVLEMGVIIGGMIIPALRRWKREWLPQRWDVIYPDSALFLTAFFAVGIHVYHTATEWLGRGDLLFVERSSELQETYYFWFILLYFMFKRRAFKASKAPAR